MTQGEFPVTIQASPADVWPWISQLEKHVEWSTKAYTIEWISGEPDAVGSRYRSVGWIPGDKHHKNEGTITESVPNERFALDAEDDQGIFKNTYTLKDLGGSTEVRFRIVFPQLKGMLAIMAPVAFATLGKPDTRKRMQLLKEKVESSG
jgi:uncharacterized protein YndB with AHSA1/START domain